MTGLRLENISKEFDGKAVLRDVSLVMDEGELLVVLGPSGCGKSTLLRLIAGLENPDEGAIYIGERRVDRLHPRERNVAMVFQNYALYPHMAVESNLAFPLKIARVSKKERQRRVHEVARLLGLTEKLSARPGQLSGGQRQRVALGRAIIRNPDLFLLDEPLSNLDADLRVRMRYEISRIQRTLRITTVFVTHDQTEALTLADRIAIMNEGYIVQTGTPEELYNNPGNLFVAQFIGSPKINIIETEVTDNLLTLFSFPVSTRLASHSNKVVVGIRPDKVKLVDSDGNITVDAVVNGCEFHGERYVVNAVVGNERIVVSNVKTSIAIGEKIVLSINPSELLFFDLVTGQRIDK